MSAHRDDGSELPDLVLLKVNLLKTNAQAISRLQEMTGDTATDCVNRAIAFYEWMVANVFLHNRELFVEDGKRISRIMIDWIKD